MPYADREKRLLHTVWKNMIGRCMVPGHPNRKRYGDRGISVCEEWLEFAPFYEWAIDNGYRQGLTIDREDNDGNYCPENCRWVTPKVNANNRSNNVLVEFNGTTKTVQEWANHVGVTHQAMSDRLKSNKWTLEEALTYPKNKKSVKQPAFYKKIEQYTVDGEFVRRWDSLTEAANELHLYTSNICAALKSDRRITGGYRWRYAE